MSRGLGDVYKRQHITGLFGLCSGNNVRNILVTAHDWPSARLFRLLLHLRLSLLLDFRARRLLVDDPLCGILAPVHLGLCLRADAQGDCHKSV